MQGYSYEKQKEMITRILSEDPTAQNKSFNACPASKTWQEVYENLKYRLEYLPLAPDECYVDIRLGDLRLIFENLTPNHNAKYT